MAEGTKASTLPDQAFPVTVVAIKQWPCNSLVSQLVAAEDTLAGRNFYGGCGSQRLLWTSTIVSTTTTQTSIEETAFKSRHRWAKPPYIRVHILDPNIL